MNQEIITADGEIIEETGLVVQSSMAVQLQKAEIDQLVSTARAFPRSLKRVQSNILSMATLDEESAEECIYALPRGGKPIRGPSIRFAEILKQSYGNCQSAARVVHVDKSEKYVEAEGVFIDLETNSKSTARVRRRISGRNGAVFNDDMIIVTGNAACSIAMRNAILAGVPKPLWRKAYDLVQATITGDVTTLSENREKAFKALAAFGVKPEQVFVGLGIEGVEDITVDHIATLRGMYSALKNGEATVEEMFVGTIKATSDHLKIADPLSDAPIKQNTETSADVSPSDADAGSDIDAIAPNERVASAPFADDESALESSGDDVASPSSSLDSEIDDFAEHTIGRNPAVIRELKRECKDKLLHIATSDLPAGERRGVLERTKNIWKDELPESLEFVRICFETADKVIKKELTPEFALKYLNGLVGA